MGRVSSVPLYAAGRVCPNCAEPLSIYFDDERCRRCFHSYNVHVLHALERKTKSAQIALEKLANVPKYEELQGK